MIILSEAMIKLPPIDTPHFYCQNPKFFPFFKDCIGAVDGSHYDTSPPAEFTEVYRNRKGALTTNVMAAVDFNGRFIHLLAGWEGSAHDWKVYVDAIRRGFVVPEGKYLLADAGYNCSYRLLTPFRGIRYHLQESARQGLRPETPEELYNLRHSQARIIVEKALGRHKNTFRILTSRPWFPTSTQVKILYATAALMNWIIDYSDAETFPSSEDFEIDENLHIDELAAPQAQEPLSAFRLDELDGSDEGGMAMLRRKISCDMWEQYQSYLREVGG